MLLIVSFGMLCLTGIPQKFHDAALARWIINTLGGITVVQTIHHVFAFMMAGETVYHIAALVRSVFVAKSRNRFSMVPGKSDLVDAWQDVSYNLGRRQEPARAGRFSWKEKLEYWALIWGTAVMMVTGAILLWPSLVTRVIPGYFVPAAKAAHGAEALLAFLAILIWHFYNTHFSRGKMPLDTSMFTGKVTRERMEHEHPRELEAAERAGAHARPAKPSRR